MIGDALGEQPFCYLTTIGRITGLPRRIEIWFALNGTTLYMLSGNRDNADWVKNALRQPFVTIQIGDGDFAVRARLVENDAEDALARRLLLEKYSAQEELDDWARKALPIAFDFASKDATDGAKE